MRPEQPDPHFSSSFISSTRWWSKDTVAIVTGANKGIGFALVKRLAELELTVILTAREVERGERAVESLARKGLPVSFFQLDVSDPSSINNFVSWFKSNFGVLDILVNNAGVTFNDIDENRVEHEYAKTVIRTNFYGAKLLTEALLPLFRRPSPFKTRILNITSRLGSLKKVRNPSIKEILESEELTEEQIEYIVGLFLESVKKGTWKSQGWPEIWTDYAVSKLALNAYSRVLAKRYEREGISVNSYCPGFTQTSMTGGKGTHTADDVAEVAARLLLLPPQELPTAKFYIRLGSSIKSKL